MLEHLLKFLVFIWSLKNESDQTHCKARDYLISLFWWKVSLYEIMKKYWKADHSSEVIEINPIEISAR